MKILYDSQIFFLQKYGGVSTYFVNLVNHLSNNKDSANIFAPFYICQILKYLKLEKFIKGKKIEKIPRYSTKIIKFINEFFFEVYVKIYKPDIIHFTYFEKKFNFNTVKKIVTVYDCIHEKFYNIKNHKRRIVDTADHIICISKNTQQDLLKIYGVKEEKTSVVYLGSSFSKDINNLSDINIDKKPYILFVGNRFKYKNFIYFIKSISLSKILKNNVEIICFGIYPFTQSEIEFFMLEGFDVKKIRFVKGDDSILRRLYVNALMLVYPSLYEGFGLPILDAMSLGCPVACGKNSSTTEVGGDAPEYFDANNLYDIKLSIEKIFLSESLRIKMITKGLKQSKKFSWKNCALETLSIYKKII
jgi:glycosyltransferase involved in cell wall biosynthesis